ncbi:MAG: DUF975 family protein [Candidatus Fimadaptatus sp.]|jgi:uncharacterized membrane protein
MLDRKTIKKDVKGILSGESKGPVLLATLIVFMIGLVYFGGVWVAAQFFPLTQAELTAAGSWAKAMGDAAKLGTVELSAQLLLGLEAQASALQKVGIIQLIAMALELLIMVPLCIGVQKFMLRVIRLKNPGAGTVFKGYSGSCYLRSIILPFWRGLCMLGWQLIMLILLCGMLAGTALATGLKIQDMAGLKSGLAAISGDYISKYGWLYPTVLGVWMALDVWLMIFKGISYSFSGMALAERPQIGVRKALRASRRITRRNHFSLMVVSLSFIGWYLLAMLAPSLVVAMGVGLNMMNMGQLGLIITLALMVIVILIVMYLLMPYRVGVHAQCYVRLKRAALEDGTVIRDDFRGKRELRDAEGN